MKTQIKMSDQDIVISGMGGRFPESNNIDEFCQNLFAGVDMVTNKDDRWPDGKHSQSCELISKLYLQVRMASRTEWDAFRTFITSTARSLDYCHR